MQGVYLPDESYVEPGHTLYDRAVDAAFSAELADASRAVHGDLTRAPAPGHASGTWKSDVSGWVMAWIVGVEDYRIDVRPRACTARVSVTSPLDPVRLDPRRASDRRPGTGAYVPFALMVNRQLDSGGVSYAPEFQDVGRLREGSWEPADRRYDSLATWQVDRAHDTVRPSPGARPPRWTGPGRPGTT